jgi:YHS domain-containing protein
MNTHKLSIPSLVLASSFIGAPVYSAQSTAQTTQSQTAAAPEPIRNIEEWDLSKSNLAIDGYDPVAYFPEGGSKAKKGKKSISTTYRGTTYRFATESNRDTFLTNPAKFEPAYGGWCAWAMSKGSKTEVDPKSFIVQDDRLYLFYKGIFGNTKKDWLDGEHDQLESSADNEWKDISGESPRLGKAADQ